ncbi:MAG: hypothetical protein RIR28_1032, partial [Pseudomonadota bacterium]
MQVTITGHHLPVTDAIHSYVEQKLAKAWRHFDHGIQAHVVLSVERLDQKAEVTVHLQGKDLHAESTHSDLYAAIPQVTQRLPHVRFIIVGADNSRQDGFLAQHGADYATIFHKQHPELAQRVHFTGA